MNNILRINASKQDEKNKFTEKILNASAAYKKKLKIHPVQDFVEEKLYYGFRMDDVRAVINSDKTITNLRESESLKLAPVTNEIPENYFPVYLINDYVNGQIDVEPYNIFKMIKDYIERFTQFHSPLDCDLLSLYCMGTYLFRMFRYYPYINLNAEKGSGKSNLMATLTLICFNGEMFASPTEAILFRSSHYSLSTMLLDEMENIFHDSRLMKNSDIAQILKTGFQRGGAVKRCDKEDYTKLNTFSTFTPKIIANINSTEEVLADRMIIINLPRRTKNLQKYVETEIKIQEEQRQIRDLLYIFGLLYAGKVYEAYKNLLNDTSIEQEIPNRTLDLWSPLLALAKVGDPAGKLFSEMYEYAKIQHQDKINNDIEENKTSRLYTLLYNLISNPEGINTMEETEGELIIPTRDLLHYLKINRLYFQSTNRLTRTLKIILKENETVNIRKRTGQVRHYIICKQKLIEQYTVFCR